MFAGLEPQWRGRPAEACGSEPLSLCSPALKEKLGQSPQSPFQVAPGLGLILILHLKTDGGSLKPTRSIEPWGGTKEKKMMQNPHLLLISNSGPEAAHAWRAVSLQRTREKEDDFLRQGGSQALISGYSLKGGHRTVSGEVPAPESRARGHFVGGWKLCKERSENPCPEVSS